MKILGIIPARGGSKGVPYKNIKLLNEKPLIQYTSEVATNSKLLDKVILSSEDKKIITIAKKLNLEIPFIRPNELAQDNSTTIDVVKHALYFFLKQNITFDAICILQVTSPIRTVSFLDNALQKFINDRPDCLISVKEVPHQYNPHWTFIKNDLGNLKIATGEKQIISRRQELPKAYIRDGSIYITKTSIILENNSLYGEKISYIVSPKDSYLNIDTMKDWKEAERKIKNL